MIINCSDENVINKNKDSIDLVTKEEIAISESSPIFTFSIPKWNKYEKIPTNDIEILKQIKRNVFTPPPIHLCN